MRLFATASSSAATNPETPAEPCSRAASESATTQARLADDRLLRHLMESFGPLGVPLPLLDFWRDSASTR
jgi:hypothetical protein